MMNKKNLIIAILLVFVVIISSNSVFAQEITENNTLQQGDNIAIISQTDDNKLSSQQTVSANSTSAEIQEKINSLSDGDTLNFEAGEYKDICIYINKNITVNGNGATLIGYDTPSQSNTPEIIYKATNESGYAIGNLATLYIVKTTGVTINGLNIIGGANSASTYSNALVYAMNSNNLTFTNNTLDGSSWGLYFQSCADGTVSNNIIKNQKTTGFLNFGSARTTIENNKVINAKNHGIDVRHGTGPNVQIINNTVIGSKEGIYLMHSAGHTATDNTLINCTISSITCYGSANVNIKNNKLQKSRIGVLLGGGYSNITLDENTFNLDNLPFPPTFTYNVAEGQGDYQSAEDIKGTYSDSSSNDITYTAYTGIETPKEITISYDSILKKTGTEYTVPEDITSADLQKMITGMKDGDSLSFAKNAVYENISIYVDKNIKVFGNNATLIGYNNIDLNNVPEKVTKETAEGGYAVAYRAVLYVINTTNAVVSDLNIKAQYPGYDTTKVGATTDEYKTVGLYADKNTKLTITGCDIQGASWGIFLQSNENDTISKNNIHDIYTTGIMNFGSKNTIITENTITDAVNHGIDVRHGTGPNVTIFNNTVSGAKEGIYLMHSKGHTVYGNTILDSKISGITAYGSGEESIFNNTISGSRLGIMLGGGYYNVTIGENTYKLDFLPFPPTFTTFLVKAENKYQGNTNNSIGTYSDHKSVNLNVANVTAGYNKGELIIVLTDIEGNPIANQTGKTVINNNTYDFITDEKGSATIALNLTAGIYNVTTETLSSYDYKSGYAESIINVTDDRITTELTASNKTIYLQAITKGTNYIITLKDANGTVLTNKTITVSFNGKTQNATTDEKGIATVKLTATKTGSQKANIIFAGDDEYKDATAIATVKITKEASKIKAAKKSFKAKTKTKKYKVTLKTKSGKAIKKVKVTIKIKGKTYKAKTTAKGVATLKITKLTKKGKYTATVKFAGNKYFKATSKKVKITIK